MQIWDLAAGRELRRLEGHRSAVNAVAFTPDGRSIVSGSEDGTALVWDVSDLKRRLEDRRAPRPPNRSRPAGTSWPATTPAPPTAPPGHSASRRPWGSSAIISRSPQWPRRSPRPKSCAA